MVILLDVASKGKWWVQCAPLIQVGLKGEKDILAIPKMTDRKQLVVMEFTTANLRDPHELVSKVTAPLLTS